MSITSTIIRFMFNRADKKRDKGLTTPDDILRYDDIVYGPYGKWNLLDVYRPRHIQQPLPVIINIHGGGWVYGTKEVYQYYCMSLAQKGFAVVNLNYRLAPEYKFPTSLEDLNRVIEWVFKSPDDYGFDLDNIFLIGDSAGANMAALYSCICTNHEYSKFYDFDIPNNFIPKGLGLSCGMYEVVGKPDNKKKANPLLKDYLGKDNIMQRKNLIEPLRHITKDFPPVFVMTSTGDFLKEQIKPLCERLNIYGIPYISTIYGDEVTKPPHVFHCNIRSDIAKQCNEDMSNYLKSLVSR